MGKLSIIRTLLSTFWRRIEPALSPNTIYSRELPTDQVAVDLYKNEWTCQLPGADVVAGANLMFTKDLRPAWADRHMGGVRGKKVLELGPLEGAHTYLLEKLGADVVAIESNKFAFQRCLIVKNILGLRAKFLLGNFVPYAGVTKDHYDMVFASGVLYHMQEPVQVLQDLCRICDSIFLWTHHYDPEVINKNSYQKKMFASGVVKSVTVNGLKIDSYERRYSTRFLTYFVPGFCGGMHVKTYWMKLGDILKVLGTFGFEIVAAEPQTDHDNGPSVNIFARRKKGTTH